MPGIGLERSLLDTNMLEDVSGGQKLKNWKIASIAVSSVMFCLAVSLVGLYSLMIFKPGWVSTKEHITKKIVIPTQNDPSKVDIKNVFRVNWRESQSETIMPYTIYAVINDELCYMLQDKWVKVLEPSIMDLKNKNFVLDTGDSTPSYNVVRLVLSPQTKNINLQSLRYGYEPKNFLSYIPFGKRIVNYELETKKLPTYEQLKAYRQNEPFFGWVQVENP